MRKVQLVAVKPLTYGTRRLRAGDAFMADRKHAEVLKLVGRAADAPVCAAPKERPVERPDPDAALRARYAELTGQEANKRWGAARLQREIDTLNNAAPTVEAPAVRVEPEDSPDNAAANGSAEVADSEAREGSTSENGPLL